jgi:uncharacterized membrane protein YphA (DoxX/SURF4 family)
MDRVLAVGRPFFATAMAAFGLQQLLYGDFVPGPLIAPAWVPWRGLWAWASGLALTAGAIGVLTRKARPAAVLLAVLLFVCVLVFHLPAPLAILYDGIARTRAFEALSLGGIALLVAGPPFVKAGRLVFGLPLTVFGIQHFMYARFVVMAEPSWMPGKLFWAYFTGIAFIAASVAIVFRTRARLAANLLGLMFLLWFVLLHVPNVATMLRDGNQWNSAFVALAMCGGAWILSGTLRKGDRSPGDP